MLYHGGFYYGKERKHHGKLYHGKTGLSCYTMVASTMVKTENTMVGITMVKSDYHAEPWWLLLYGKH